MWTLTQDHTSEPPHSFEIGKICSRSFSEEKSHLLVHRFRLLDDDGRPQGVGFSDSCDDQKAFGPLDDFGEGAWGSTAIEFWKEGRGVWQML